ncbi:MAG: hypothetical protein K8F62_01020, partial [Pseudorhodoplanes sp.]|nr:hypothetical protein [Pseudorhodoplanes sp.]
MLPKTGKVLPKRDRRSASNVSYAEAVAAALHQELGDSHRAIKIVMRWTGASERTAKYWFAGTKGPTGEHLLSLVRHSDAVLGIFMQLAGREACLLSLELADLRSRLTDILESIEQALENKT